jgi:hypothetical protein
MAKRTPPIPQKPEIEYDEAGTGVSDQDAKAALIKVKAMVDAMMLCEENVAIAENTLALAKERLLKIERVDLPDLIRETGLMELTLEDGVKVKIVDEIDCGVSQERKPMAYDWLREHGAGALIKVVVGVVFGKGEEAKAATLTSQLIKKYGADNVTDKEDVHYQTLKSYIKGQLAAAAEYDGEPAKAPPIPPTELFGIQPYSKAKITLPKVKAGKV